jgi:serine/threonine kinase 32
LEEVLLEENPLKVRKRTIQPKTSFSNEQQAVFPTTAAMDDKRLLEENFISFDYTKPEENEKRYNKASLNNKSNATRRKASS